MKMNQLEKSIVCGLLVAVLAVTASGYSAFAGQCSDIRQNVFRLHILANSDSAADQQLKLHVRDRILASSGELFKASVSKAQAIAQVRKKLGEIQRIAQAEVYREGYSYPVRAQVVHMYFTTRTYGAYILPAGYYDALRITIGRAAGHNWWCVLFPPLCLPAAQEDPGTKQQLEDVLGGTDAGIVTQSGNRTVVLKFKVLELYEDAKNFLSETFSVPSSSGAQQ